MLSQDFGLLSSSFSISLEMVDKLGTPPPPLNNEPICKSLISDGSINLISTCVIWPTFSSSVIIDNIESTLWSILEIHTQNKIANNCIFFIFIPMLVFLYHNLNYFL